MLYPHEVFAAVYEASPALFKKVFLGPEGSEGLRKYWRRQRRQPWVQQHPALQGKSWKYAVPIGIHADKGQHIKRDKILVISWSSCMSIAPTAWSKILFSILPSEFEVPGVSAEELYAVLVWSLDVLASGVWPSADHNGKPWPYGSRRWALAGKRLAGQTLI